MESDSEINAARIPESEKTGKALKLREIKEHFLPLIYELSDLQVYIAVLEISNSAKAASTIKKALSDHKKNIAAFYRMIDNLKAEIDRSASQRQKIYYHNHEKKYHGAKNPRNIKTL